MASLALDSDSSPDGLQVADDDSGDAAVALADDDSSDTGDAAVALADDDSSDSDAVVVLNNGPWRTTGAGPSTMALGAPQGQGRKRARCEPPCRQVSCLGDCFAWPREALLAIRQELGEGLHQRLSARRWAMATYFSGLGTAELAVDMLRAAFPLVARAELHIEVVASCEKAVGLQRVLSKRSDACVFGDVFERVAADAAVACDAYRKAARSARVAPASRCQKHMAACPTKPVDIVVAGPSCRPWSSSNRGKSRGTDHPDIKQLYAWCRLMREDAPSIIILENVRGFDEQVVERQLGDLYMTASCLTVSPSDVGFWFVRRPRRYLVLTRRVARINLDALPSLYERLRAALSKESDSWHQWVWRATPSELEAEYAAACARRSAPTHRGADAASWRDLLTAPQQSRLAEYETQWLRRHGISASKCPACVFDLGDTPLYLQHLPSVGNAMHVANVGAVMLATLSAAVWHS